MVGDVHLSYDIDYRSTKDDGWYTAGVLLDDGMQQLRVKLKDFDLPENDEVFAVGDFSTRDAVEEFIERFRPLSIPAEDNECSRVVQGMTVCAMYTCDGSLRYFDALVDAVHHREHRPEKCVCTYLLFWQHGPDEGNVTAASIDHICLITPGRVDPRVIDFTNLAKEKLKGASSQSNSVSFLGFSKGRGMLNPQMSDHDRDLGGIEETGCHHYIILENLEKDLSPSVMMEFIHAQTSITAQAYVFQSLSVETYARGVIVLDSRPKLKRIYEFISNPNHFIVSLTGRPWVIAEDTLKTETFKTDMRSLHPKPENKDMESKLMVVRAGTEEYKRAKKLKELFMEFRNHLNGLLNRLDVEEKKCHSSHAN